MPWRSNWTIRGEAVSVAGRAFSREPSCPRSRLACCLLRRNLEAGFRDRCENRLGKAMRFFHVAAILLLRAAVPARQLMPALFDRCGDDGGQLKMVGHDLPASSKSGYRSMILP